MDIGKLKHRITIQEFVSVEDDWGGSTHRWETRALTWAQVQGVDGKEFLAAGAIQAKTTWKIITRHIPNLSSTARIVMGDRYFNIKAILPNNNRSMMTIMAEEGVNNG